MLLLTDIYIYIYITYIWQKATKEIQLILYWILIADADDFHDKIKNFFFQILMKINHTHWLFL